MQLHKSTAANLLRIFVITTIVFVGVMQCIIAPRDVMGWLCVALVLGAGMFALRSIRNVERKLDVDQ